MHKRPGKLFVAPASDELALLCISCPQHQSHGSHFSSAQDPETGCCAGRIRSQVRTGIPPALTL
jgi:hypothetical protein